MLSRSLIAATLALASQTHSAKLESIDVPVEFNIGWGNHSGTIMQSQFETTPRLELALSSVDTLTVSARLRVDARDELEPGTPSLDNYAAFSRPATIGSTGTLELRDAYWERRLNQGVLRLGKQQVVWGRLDGIKVLDVLHPQNFREFILDDFQDSRISQWTAYLDLFMGAWRLETVLIPDYSAHEIPKPGAWFELTAPRFRFGAEPGSPNLPTTTESQREFTNDGALGGRLSRSSGRVDMSFLAYRGNDHEPLGRLVESAGAPGIEKFYRRRTLFGASAETSFGPVALRAETAYQPSRTFNTRNSDGLATAQADQMSAGIAADIDGPLGVFINLQILWDEIISPPEGLVRPDRDRLATIFLRRNFAYDTLTTEARWYHSFDDGDDIFKLSLAYEISDGVTAFISGDWFTGTSSGLFGQFSQRDRIVVGIKQAF